MATSTKGNTFIGLLVIGAIVLGLFSLFNDDEEYYSQSASTGNYDYSYDASYKENNYYDDPYEDSYYEENYESPVGFEGTEEMEACNGSTGNCYDLEIDSDGEEIERINFPNGGWRDVDYSDCENGYCTVEDEDGTEWELTY